MAKAIRRVAVLGSGVLGSGIAAHMANAGLEVLLLDIVPKDAGTDPRARNRVADCGPEVETEMKKFVLASLYTDGEGEIYEKQQAMEQEMFGTVALPFYAVVDGDGKVIGTFAGLTRDAQEFADFLKKAQN